MTIDTACSSSLIATHQAVQSLRRGESNLAVAAGANLIFGPTNFVAESEGVAAVLLKRLSDAIRDGDHIESIIRETGANQDGRTPGITMPSSTSQSNLIRETYARAGLSLEKGVNRCQYFEAHGTGTKAGDPQEAAAIHQAFFGDRDASGPDDILYVGSIKTIIGHTEGTAGLAGLLKASLSVQTGTIFPNLLFENLNSDIEPYYGNLQIATNAKPWPELPAGVPRRASVNSFGFGGANAHAIIECYDPQVHDALVRKAQIHEIMPATAEMSLFTAIPFMFSGNSEKTLSTQIETYLAFLKTALEEERSLDIGDLAWTLSRRSAFALRAHCSATSLQSLHDQLEAMLDAKRHDNKNLGVRPSHKTKSIFGISTGQGAQWPLDDSLQSLPEEDRPSWHIQEELSKPADASSVMEAAFSQPLCTAVQVVLVQMLAHSGITFDAVVGHSSGEIAAAYAAGFLSAGDALACGVGGVPEDAIEFVAASNSSASFVFEDEKNFVRALKVDTAYHSHHMKPCEQPVQQPKNNCMWFSSVLKGTVVTKDMKDQLCGSYWKDNLLKPVMFSQALESALDALGAPALMLEIGAHPALKGPASMVAEEKTGAPVPYCGFSNAIGAVWENVGSSALNIRHPTLLQDVPLYTWDHSTPYWTESRMSRALRLRPHSHNELLGARLDSGENELRWRNFLKPSELTWVKGHQIQGQTIFPAFVNDGSRYNSIALIELQDLTIRRAVSFPDESIGVESIVTLRNIKHDDDTGFVQCDFVCETSLGKDIKLRLGQVSWESNNSNVPLRGRLELFTLTVPKIMRRSLLLHPAPLDVVFQGIFGAIGSPGDVIRSLRINVSGTEETACLGVDVAFDATVTADPSTHEVYGDVDVFDANGNAILQIEGLHVTPVVQQVWGIDRIDAAREFVGFWHTAREQLDMACFTMHEVMPREKLDEMVPHMRKYVNWVASVVSEVALGTHPTIQREWLHDNKNEYLRSIVTFGENLLSYESRLPDNIYTHTYGLQEYNIYFAGVVEQLVHKTRQMQILEAIISRIGDNFGSYTYTDLSPAFFAEAHTLFSEQSDKRSTQGLHENAYDLVVVSNVLHATIDLKQTLRNLRKTLKPGGHLTLLDFTDARPVRQPFFFGTMSNWWAARDGDEMVEARHPILSQYEWDGILKETGFSGIDSATPETRNAMVPFSLMLTQAVDVQMKMIRQPLAPKTAKSTSRLQCDVLAALKPFTTESEISIVDRLENLNESHFGPKQLVLSFMELDTPAFSPFTPERWTAMQLMTEKALNILWLTRGVSGDNPYSNMMVGVSRCLVHEKPDLRFQVVDFDTFATVNARCVAELLIRLHLSSLWKGFPKPYESAWVLEREIRVEGDEFIIPRCVPSRDLDARHNSVRRKITKQVPLDESLVAIAASSTGSFELQHIQKPDWAARAEVTSGSVEIQVHRSTLSALEIPHLGSNILSLARRCMDNKRSWLSRKRAGLRSTFERIGSLRSIHRTSRTLTSSLLAAEWSLSTNRPPRPCNLFTPWYIGQPSAVLSQPTYLCFPIWPNREYISAHTGELIEAQIPSKVPRLHMSHTYDIEAHMSSGANEEAALKMLQKAREIFGVHSGLASAEDFQELGLAAISTYTQKEEASGLAIMNWNLQDEVAVPLSPPERAVEFRNDRTYWLAGLTSDLGLSLTRWMSQRGARYVVMTSRNPKVDDKWIASMEAAGTTVKVLPMDLTDAESVKKTHQIITSTLPPIAGVCNGATVMNDELMAKQSYEDFSATLGPKVDGTIYLDALFQKPGELDFFIVFSSLAYSTGNIGQTSYAAANAFMVVWQASWNVWRRWVTPTFPNGTISGSSRKLCWLDVLTLQTRLGRYLRQCVRATLMVITRLPWLDVPRFSYYKRMKGRVVDDDDDATVSVRAQLKNQTSIEGVRSVLYSGLVGILYKLLGMKPDDNIISPSTSLIELGIDSLVAVDMRFWFTRELDLDLPVLKLLGGATVEEMVEDVVDRLSPSLIPNIKIEKAEDTLAANSTREAPGDEPAIASKHDTDHAKTELLDNTSDPTSDDSPAGDESSDTEKDDKSSTDDNTDSLSSAEELEDMSAALSQLHL
ncbi:putative polyketide synthase [Astrocystis sublimbata]|nr:putative polyketide synthase [Astrocystis sublimbata]